MIGTTSQSGSGGAGVVARAALWSIGTLAAFTLLAVAGREAGRHMPTVHIMLHRGWIGGIVVVVVAMATGGGFGGLAVLSTRRIGLHAWRNVVHFLAQYAWFWALTQVPLAHVFAIEFTIPIWLTLLAPLMLAERLTATRLAAVAIGFAGVMVVLRPTGTGLHPGIVAALASAVGYALSVVAVKWLTRTDSVLAILFWMCALQTLYGIVLGWQVLAWPPAVAMGWLAVVALCGLVAHYCMTQAYAIADTLIVAPMDFMRLPLIAGVGLIAYGEPIDIWVMIGGGIIAIGIMVNLLGERRRIARA